MPIAVLLCDITSPHACAELWLERCSQHGAFFSRPFLVAMASREAFDAFMSVVAETSFDLGDKKKDGAEVEKATGDEEVYSQWEGDGWLGDGADWQQEWEWAATNEYGRLSPRVEIDVCSGSGTECEMDGYEVDGYEVDELGGEPMEEQATLEPPKKKVAPWKLEQSPAPPPTKNATSEGYWDEEWRRLLKQEEVVARDMGIPWQSRGPPGPSDGGPNKWRGQNYREQTGKWANRGGHQVKHASWGTQTMIANTSTED